MVLAACPGDGQGAVITAAGGAMAHLVTVARPKGITMVCVKGAERLYPARSMVYVDASTGSTGLPARIEISSANVRSMEAHPDPGGWVDMLEEASPPRLSNQDQSGYSPDS